LLKAGNVGRGAVGDMIVFEVKLDKIEEQGTISKIEALYRSQAHRTKCYKIRILKYEMSTQQYGNENFAETVYRMPANLHE